MYERSRDTEIIQSRKIVAAHELHMIVTGIKIAAQRINKMVTMVATRNLEIGCVISKL